MNGFFLIVILFHFPSITAYTWAGLYLFIPNVHITEIKSHTKACTLVHNVQVTMHRDKPLVALISQIHFCNKNLH